MATKPKSAKKPSAADKLTKTSKKGEVELKEDELKKVTGGGVIYKGQ
jgi:hypothetical protein